MKIFKRYALVLPLLGLMTSRASASLIGPVTLHLVAEGQEFTSMVVHSNEVQGTISTNITFTEKSALTNSVIDANAVVRLLENSFNTNYPAGARLSFDLVHFYVTDRSGTNILQDVSSVLVLSNETLLTASAETQLTRITSSATNISGSFTESQSTVENLLYDDSALTSSNTFHTKFHLRGLATIPFSSTLATERTVATVVMLHGVGSGVIQDSLTKLLTGSMTMTVKGINN